jgi:FAD/FMN-containing dehydrogenase
MKPFGRVATRSSGSSESGICAAALEFLDAGAIAVAGSAFPFEIPEHSSFLVLVDTDGSRAEAERLRTEVVDALGPGALRIDAPHEPAAIADIWRWRDGVSIAVTAQLGAKVSEDVVVPLDRLAEAIDETVAIGNRHRLAACTWGHAGDGNLHSTFMLAEDDEDALERADLAAGELFALALRLGGSISGEHGVGWTKRGWVERRLDRRGVELHTEVKRAFDPQGLLNPGKKS